MEGLFRASTQWRKPWLCGKRGCRNPEQGELQRFSAGARQLPQKWACRGNEHDEQWHFRPDILYDIVPDMCCYITTISKLRTTISCLKIDLRYWIRYRSSEMPISKFMTYDIDNLRYHVHDIVGLYLRYSRSPKITYDIVGFIRYRRTTIS